MYKTAVETELTEQGLGYCRQTSAQLFPVTSGHLNQLIGSAGAGGRRPNTRNHSVKA